MVYYWTQDLSQVPRAYPTVCIPTVCITTGEGSLHCVQLTGNFSFVAGYGVRLRKYWLIYYCMWLYNNTVATMDKTCVCVDGLSCQCVYPLIALLLECHMLDRYVRAYHVCTLQKLKGYSNPAVGYLTFISPRNLTNCRYNYKICMRTKECMCINYAIGYRDAGIYSL